MSNSPPLQVIAFTCCFITVILMTAATSTADWILAEGWREGLFMQCIEEGAPTPLPFNMDPTVGCSKARSAGDKRRKVTNQTKTLTISFSDSTWTVRAKQDLCVDNLFFASKLTPTLTSTSTFLLLSSFNGDLTRESRKKQTGKCASLGVNEYKMVKLFSFFEQDTL